MPQKIGGGGMSIQRDERRRYVERAARKFREELTALVAEYVRMGVQVGEVLGDPDEFAARAIRAIAPLASPWDDLAGPFTSSRGVQARLGVTRQAVVARAGRRGLLRVITADGRHVYPLWQFDGGHLLPGLSDVLAFFPEDTVDGWTLAAWLRTPDPALEEPPIDALRRGDEEAVLAVARRAAQSLGA